MPRIKILIYEPYVFKVYGNLKLLLFMFRLLDRRKFEPILVAPFESDFLDTVRRVGGRCIALPAPARLTEHGGRILKASLLGKCAAALAIARYTAALVSLIKIEDVHIIQCHSIRSLITIGLAVKITRRPCIWYVKGELDNKILDRIGFFLAHRIVFLCDSLKSRKYCLLNRYFQKKIRILHLGIDLDEIVKVERSDKTKIENEIGFSPKNVNIAFLGVVSPQKGLHYLLHAMVKVKKAVPNVKLYIVGDHCINEYKQFKTDLDNIIRLHGLDSHVVFTGWREDAINVLSLMHFLVLPSLTEGFGRCIVEAMALGKPAIGTKVGGVPEAIRHNETGLVVEARDSEALANAIITLAKKKELRKQFGENAKRIAFAQYSIKENISGLEKLYKELADDIQ
jgi:glycosyltransferase involved in cell wall biosynthesis